MSRRLTGRPAKEPGETRDKRIVIWVNTRERARYLVNASRTGLTGADYARTLLCHDPTLPRTSNDNSAAREIVIAFGAQDHRNLVERAAAHHKSPEIYVRGLVNGHLDASTGASPSTSMPADPASEFQFIDALTRLGVDLHQIAPIVRQTGEVPGELDAILDRLDHLLDQLLPT